MRKSFCSLSAVIIAAALLAFTSCTGEIVPERQSDLSNETVSVTLNALSFEFATSPMTKSVPQSGLYGVQIRPWGMEYINNEIHACWLTEDLSSQPFKLKKGTTYIISVVFVPNGQEVLESSEGIYGPPFMNGNGPGYASPVLGNDIYYGGSANINSAALGVSQKKGKGSWLTQSNLLNDVEIYYGGTKITAESDVNLDINLFRCMFGLQIEVLNLTEGKIHVYECEYTNDSYGALQKNDGISYTLTPGESCMDLALELVHMPFGVYDEETYESYQSPLHINIDYEYPDGSVVTLFKKSAEVRRMVKYSFSFDLADVLETVSGGMNVSLRDEDWQYSTLDGAVPNNPWDNYGK